MEPTEKVREDRVRRMLARQGYQLTRSRRRDPRASDFGRYAIMDWNKGVFVAGASGEPPRYGMTLDDAEKWALEGERPVQDWEEIDATVAAGWLSQIASGGGDGPYAVKVLRDTDGKILRAEVNLSSNRSGQADHPRD